MINYTGKEYLMIDIASQYGLDKKNFEPRIEWVQWHEDNLEKFIDRLIQYGETRTHIILSNVVSNAPILKKEI